MSNLQRTIKKEISIDGVGLHTGKNVTLTFCPAPENHGYKFLRTDFGENAIINADCNLVTETSRGTTLESGELKVATTEHVLAALKGLEIDNVLIKLNESEVPIMDGSAKPFVDALLKAEIVAQEKQRNYFELDEIIEFYDEEKQVKMMAIPSKEYEITAMIDFDSPVLGCQHASLNSLKDFKNEIADARTFCFLHELKLLLEHNLIKGGDLNNAIVVVDETLEGEDLKNIAKHFGREDVEIAEQGILNNVKLRYNNEPAKHKLLDILGDLALIGTPLKAKIIADKPGHKTNIEFAKKIKEHIKAKKRLANPPKYDPNAVPVYSTKQVLDLLPHKAPFMLLDKVMELTKEKVVAVKNVTFNEPFFVGHFPNNPIMPGVLIVEAMAQGGGILALNTVDDPENYLTYFTKIESARFRNPVLPGDTLVFELDLMAPIRRGLCQMSAKAFVGNKLTTEAVLHAVLVKKENAA